MCTEYTLSIIKPDAVFKRVIGEILNRFETSGLIISNIKMLRLTRFQAEKFYFEHEKKDFFSDLIDFMISGPIVVQILKGKNVIFRNREIMGSTNPKEALAGTLRADYGFDFIKNAVHGSDSKKSAKNEISYFFRKKI